MFVKENNNRKAKIMFYVNVYFTILDFYYFLIFIYLAVPGLSCSMQDLPSSLQHAGSLVEACGIQFPDQGLNSGPLYWEYRVLATGPPEKSLDYFSFSLNFLYFFLTLFFHSLDCKFYEARLFFFLSISQHQA